MRHRVFLAAGLIALLLTIGCGSSAPENPVDKREADVTGVVISVQPADQAGAKVDIIGSLLIEGADIAVTTETRIYERSGVALIESTFASLKEGLEVEAWFTGPVAESYPVQATAEAIVWEDASEWSGIQRVGEKHGQDLLSIDGVIGIGIGESEGELCIVVYLENDSADLAAQIPDELEGYKVETEVTGPINAL